MTELFDPLRQMFSFYEAPQQGAPEDFLRQFQAAQAEPTSTPPVTMPSDIPGGGRGYGPLPSPQTSTPLDYADSVQSAIPANNVLPGESMLDASRRWRRKFGMFPEDFARKKQDADTALAQFHAAQDAERRQMMEQLAQNRRIQVAGGVPLGDVRLPTQADQTPHYNPDSLFASDPTGELKANAAEAHNAEKAAYAGFIGGMTGNLANVDREAKRLGVTPEYMDLARKRGEAVAGDTKLRSMWNKASELSSADPSIIYPEAFAYLAKLPEQDRDTFVTVFKLAAERHGPRMGMVEKTVSGMTHLVTRPFNWGMEIESKLSGNSKLNQQARAVEALQADATDPRYAWYDPRKIISEGVPMMSEVLLAGKVGGQLGTAAYFGVGAANDIKQGLVDSGADPAVAALSAPVLALIHGRFMAGGLSRYATALSSPESASLVGTYLRGVANMPKLVAKDEFTRQFATQLAGLTGTSDEKVSDILFDSLKNSAVSAVQSIPMGMAFEAPRVGVEGVSRLAAGRAAKEVARQIQTVQKVQQEIQANQQAQAVANEAQRAYEQNLPLVGTAPAEQPNRPAALTDLGNATGRRRMGQAFAQEQPIQQPEPVSRLQAGRMAVEAERQAPVVPQEAPPVLQERGSTPVESTISPERVSEAPQAEKVVPGEPVPAPEAAKPTPESDFMRALRENTEWRKAETAKARAAAVAEWEGKTPRPVAEVQAELETVRQQVSEVVDRIGRQKVKFQSPREKAMAKKLLEPLQARESALLSERIASEERAHTPPSPVSTPAPKGKEPWEMTAKELDSAVGETPESRRESGIEPWMVTKKQAIEYSKLRDKKAGNGDKWKKGNPAMVVELVHRRAIEEALREGLPVPPSVLADYPDLKSQGSRVEPTGGESKPPKPFAFRGNQAPVVFVSGEFAGKTGVAESVVQKRYSNEQDMVRVQIDGFPKPGGWDGKVTVPASVLGERSAEKPSLRGEPIVSWKREASRFNGGEIIQDTKGREYKVVNVRREGLTDNIRVEAYKLKPDGTRSEKTTYLSTADTELFRKPTREQVAEEQGKKASVALSKIATPDLKPKEAPIAETLKPTGETQNKEQPSEQAISKSESVGTSSEGQAVEASAGEFKQGEIVENASGQRFEVIRHSHLGEGEKDLVHLKNAEDVGSTAHPSELTRVDPAILAQEDREQMKALAAAWKVESDTRRASMVPIVTKDPSVKVWANPGDESAAGSLAAKIDGQRPKILGKVGERNAAVPLSVPNTDSLPNPKMVKTDVDAHRRTVEGLEKGVGRNDDKGQPIPWHALREGDKLITTDGHWLRMAGGLTTLPEGVYTIGKDGGLKLNPEGQFPNYKSILKGGALETEPIATLDLQKVYSDLKKIYRAKGDEQLQILMVLNPDGTLGFAIATPEVATAEVNVHDGYKVIAGVGEPFADSIRWHLSMGDKKGSLHVIADDKPIGIRGADGKRETMTMPLDISESRALIEKEAISSKPEGWKPPRTKKVSAPPPPESGKAGEAISLSDLPKAKPGLAEELNRDEAGFVKVPIPKIVSVLRDLVGRAVSSEYGKPKEWVEAYRGYKGAQNLGKLSAGDLAQSFRSMMDKAKLDPDAPETHLLIEDAIRGKRAMESLPAPLREWAQNAREAIDAESRVAAQAYRDVGLDGMAETLENNLGEYMKNIPKSALEPSKKAIQFIRQLLGPRLSSSWGQMKRDKWAVKVDGKVRKFDTEQEAREAYAVALDGKKEELITNRGKAKEWALKRSGKVPRKNADGGFDLQPWEKTETGVGMDAADLYKRAARRVELIEPIPEEWRVENEIHNPVFLAARSIIETRHNGELVRLFDYASKTFGKDAPKGTQAEIDAWAKENGLVQLPFSGRLHNLKGRYVDKGIAEDLTETVDAPGYATKMYRAYLMSWKASKTVLNPATHARNVMGNFGFSFLARTSPWNPANVPHYIEAIRDIRAKGEDYRALLKENVIGTEYYGTELHRIEQALIRGGDVSRLDQAIAGAKSVYGKLGSLYAAEDQLFKVAAYKIFRAKGMTPKEATKEVNAWFPNYDRIGRLAKWIRNKPFIGVPFISFVDQAAKIAARGVIRRPLRMAAMAAMPGILSYWSAQMIGLSEDEKALIDKDRSYWQPILPYRDEKGRPLTLDLRYIVPLANDILPDSKNGTMRIPWFAATPEMQTLIGLESGRDTFTGKDIVPEGRYTTTADRWKAHLLQAAKNLAPVPTIATYGQTRIRKAAGAEPDETVLRAILGAVVGVNIRKPYLAEKHVKDIVRNAVIAGDVPQAVRMVHLWNSTYKPPFLKALNPKTAVEGVGTSLNYYRNAAIDDAAEKIMAGDENGAKQVIKKYAETVKGGKPFGLLEARNRASEMREKGKIR